MLCLVLGTRPEIIKCSPVIRCCREKNVPFRVIHTGQHYSYGMDRIFFEDLGLPQPSFTLDAGSGLHGEQTGKILAGVERVLEQERPGVVLVQGDTNSVLAGALAAAKLHIPVAHIEAGLRSFDRTMPEEINRVVADHLSDYLFAPTKTARDNLVREGIPGEKIAVTGNTIVDAVHQNLALARNMQKVSPGLEDLREKHYILVTAHRAENTDSRERLEGILSGLEGVHRETGLPVVFPVHPRTEKMMKELSLSARGIRFVAPVGYLEFLRLEAGAGIVITDSGGIQEESCILGVPCVTLRENTERPETIKVGSNVLAGTDPASIVEKSRLMLKTTHSWQNPYGDGHAAEKMVEILVAAGLG